MSYITIYAERANGDVTHYGEVSGSWGGAAYIWQTLMVVRGFVPPKDAPDHLEALGAAFTTDPNSDANPLGRLWRSLPVIYAENERDAWVLGFTFDRVLVRKADLPTLAGHLRGFRDQYTATSWRTLYDLADLLERAAADPDVVALGFNQTSVADCCWYVRLPEPDHATGDEDREYNTRTDEGHWYLTPATMRGDEEGT